MNSSRTGSHPVNSATKPQRTYLDQLQRVRRFATRLQNEDNRDSVDYDDDLWSFFQNCWHLKDWLKNDPFVIQHLEERLKHDASINTLAVTTTCNIADIIERDVNSTPVLRICGDLANRSKHATLTRHDKTGADITSRNVTVYLGSCRSVSEHIITVQHEQHSHYKARELVLKAISEWETLLTKYDLPQ